METLIKYTSIKTTISGTSIMCRSSRVLSFCHSRARPTQLCSPSGDTLCIKPHLEQNGGFTTALCLFTIYFFNENKCDQLIYTSSHKFIQIKNRFWADKVIKAKKCGANLTRFAHYNIQIKNIFLNFKTKKALVFF